tara:strand:- start:42 stop:221 length:180 start_codon:yes stop_codon:yes gene_type:complete
MSKLNAIYKAIQKEKTRIELLNNTKNLDVDFMRKEIKKAQNKVIDLQIKFDNEYTFQNN